MEDFSFLVRQSRKQAVKFIKTGLETIPLFDDRDVPKRKKTVARSLFRLHARSYCAARLKVIRQLLHSCVAVAEQDHAAKCGTHGNVKLTPFVFGVTGMIKIEVATLGQWQAALRSGARWTAETDIIFAEILDNALHFLLTTQ